MASWVGLDSLYSPTLIVCTTILFYLVAGTFYRLYLSPLAKFPGPKLAAVTLWYEAWYDVIKEGQYSFEIGRMHEKYGPIVRISPYELHINDPNYYDVLYAGAGKKRDKYTWAIRLFNAPDSAIATVHHDQHRMRRAAMNQYFSKASVRRLESIIQDNLDKLLLRLEVFQRSGESINMVMAYSAFTSDIITSYAFGESYKYLDKEDFNTAFYNAMLSVHQMGAAIKQWSWILTAMTSLPDQMVGWLDPGMMAFLNFQKQCKTQIGGIINSKYEKSEKKVHLTVFHDIIDSDLPPSEKTVDRLWQEAQILVAAGTETTAWTLSVITFHLLSKPEMLQRLRKELQDVMPDLSKHASCSQLEQLPYLSAIIQEGLRLSFGVSTRLQRISPDSVMAFSDGEMTWEIPPGTPVGMTATLMHLNPTIFPSPHEFRPERWLDNARLDRYLVAFSKGSRQCLGINLARAELHVCLAGLFRRYSGPTENGPIGQMKLFETTKEDVEIKYDLFVPIPRKGSKGVRVVFE